MYYKNASHSTKTYWGVTFQPGETKEVSGFIDDIHFYRVDKLEKHIQSEPTKVSTHVEIKSSTSSNKSDLANSSKLSKKLDSNVKNEPKTDSKNKSIELTKEETK